jgi:hypothetical protein
MPRLRFRLGSLILWVVILALSLAILVQWQREMGLRMQVLRLEKITERDHMMIDRLQFSRTRLREKLQAQIAKASRQGGDAARNKESEKGAAEGPGRQ